MKIIQSKTFIKEYKKLSVKKQVKVGRVIAIFIENPFDIRLKNHKLHGRKFKNIRSISVTSDLRILFAEEGGYAKVLLFKVGSHSQVY